MNTTLLLIIILALLAVVFFLLFLLRKKRGFSLGWGDKKHVRMDKHPENPIMEPGKRFWGSQGTFNPGAVLGSDGRVHMLYRALGDDGISRFGYACSEDAWSFEDSVSYPVFTLGNVRKDQAPVSSRGHGQPNPSGGGWSGSEDPRMVSIDGRVYVTFNAFDGWDFVRVGCVSISEKDLIAGRFAWGRPHLISPKGQVHKNWVLFPEKINGKFAILHSISPYVQIDYVDEIEDLSHGRAAIKSVHGGGAPRDSWDTRVRSAGPPPLRTDEGWLVLYHAVDKRHPQEYRLGAMLLNLDDPTEVIARAPAPILVPDSWYENDSKPGIVYACGAVIKGKDLFVYYGGGDKHVCAAQVPVKKLISWLVAQGRQS